MYTDINRNNPRIDNQTCFLKDDVGLVKPSGDLKVLLEYKLVIFFILNLNYRLLNSVTRPFKVLER
jgi:hypothetical protein